MFCNWFLALRQYGSKIFCRVFLNNLPECCSSFVCVCVCVSVCVCVCVCVLVTLMSCSGCSALYGVNPDFLKKIKLWVLTNPCMDLFWFFAWNYCSGQNCFTKFLLWSFWDRRTCNMCTEWGLSFIGNGIMIVF